MQVPDLEREGKRLMDHYKPNHNLIENKGSGIGLIQKYMREEPYGIIKVDPKGEKSMRLRNNLSKIENGRIFLPEKANWLFDYETQMTKFPKAEHDDMVDMTSQFLEWFSNRTAEFEFFAVKL
jgi:predicted phage terminase large subunit-like protein